MQRTIGSDPIADGPECTPDAGRLTMLQAAHRETGSGLLATARAATQAAEAILHDATRSVRERLALQLIVIREKYKTNVEPGQPVEINMSREDLASLAGTARENVVRMLSEFKSEGIIETRGRRIIVLDVKKLIKISNFR